MSPKDGKVAFRLKVPVEEFMKWLREFAPELSGDSELGFINSSDPEQLEIVVRTDEKYTLDYLKKTAKKVG